MWQQVQQVNSNPQQCWSKHELSDIPPEHGDEAGLSRFHICSRTEPATDHRHGTGTAPRSLRALFQIGCWRPGWSDKHSSHILFGCFKSHLARLQQVLITSLCLQSIKHSTLFIQKKKKIFTISWPQFLWRSRSYFDPQCMAFFYPVFWFGQRSNTTLKHNI